jgi:hypothetical protein
MELDTTTMNWKQSRAMTAWQGRKERLLRRTHRSVRPRAAGLVSEQFHAATFCQIVLRASCFLLPVDATILNFQSAKQTKWVQIFDCDISRNSKEKFSSAYNCAFQFSMPMCYLALTTVLYHSVSPSTDAAAELAVNQMDGQPGDMEFLWKAREIVDPHSWTRGHGSKIDWLLC